MPGQLGKIYNTEMGNTKSINKHDKDNHSRKQDSKWFINFDENPDNSEFPMEDAEIRMLKKYIKYKPEVFILNNLMMCVEFFKNYDEEISQIRQTLVSPKETILNERLLPLKRVLLPDVLQERIADNVTFISRRETVDPTVEPLQPVRIFVVYENIEVSDQHDSSQYSCMNDIITYNMRLKPSQHKGYVHLQRTDVTPSKKNPVLEEGVDLSSIAENKDECFSDHDSLYTSSGSRSQTYNYNSSNLKAESVHNLSNDEVLDERVPTSRNKFMEEPDYGSTSGRQRQRRGFNRGSQYPKKTRSVSASPASSTSSGYRSGIYDSDSEYGYRNSDKSKILDAAEVPDSCFCQVTYTHDDRIYDPTENKTSISNKERRIQVERSRHNYDVLYLNSRRFRRRFYNVFIESLASLMNLEEVLRLRRPTFFESVIYCDKVEISPSAKCNICESYEIVPCVWSQWPECANEWLERPRNNWPNYEMINQIRKSGCYIIPQEFRNKDSHLNSKTEWQLSFPAAERYLETCMNHAQMKVYIVILMLHKTFIRAVESAPDRLNTHQIRNQLFWLMEQSLMEWTDDRAGDYLINLLEFLCKCINQDEAFLKDYFLEDKNLFKNSEKGSLFFSLKQLKRILENPVMYVLHALENIRYTSQFFPKLNYERLLRILTVEEVLINQNLERNVPPPMQNYRQENIKRGFWDDAKKNGEQFSNFHKRPVLNKTLINPSRAHDSVVDIAIRCGELKGIRLSNLLVFFIEHLIEMAKRYQEYGALQQKTDYLQHAMSLCILLAEDEMFQDEARSYIQLITTIKKIVIQPHSDNEPPETPKRNFETSKQDLFKGRDETPVQHAETSNLPSTFNECCSVRLSSSLSNNEASSVSQDPLDSSKKTSDSSIFSQSLKDRFSTLSNQSLPLPDARSSSSRSSSPPMKKKSDPPAYFRSLKDHFSFTPSNASSASLPILEETKENDIGNQSSVSFNQTKNSIEDKIKIDSEKEEDLSETNKPDLEKVSDPRVCLRPGNDSLSRTSSDGLSSSLPVSDEKKENDVVSESKFSVNQSKSGVEDKMGIFSEKREDVLESNNPDVKKLSDSSHNLQPVKDRFSVSSSGTSSSSVRILEKNTGNNVISQSSDFVNQPKISVQDRIKIYSQKEEALSESNKSEVKKKVSRESTVLSLSNESEDSSNDTYI